MPAPWLPHPSYMPTFNYLPCFKHHAGGAGAAVASGRQRAGAIREDERSNSLYAPISDTACCTEGRTAACAAPPRQEGARHQWHIASLRLCTIECHHHGSAAGTRALREYAVNSPRMGRFSRNGPADQRLLRQGRKWRKERQHVRARAHSAPSSRAGKLATTRHGGDAGAPCHNTARCNRAGLLRRKKKATENNLLGAPARLEEARYRFITISHGLRACAPRTPFWGGGPHTSLCITGGTSILRRAAGGTEGRERV